jgi:hypothetical protein
MPACQHFHIALRSWRFSCLVIEMQSRPLGFACYDCVWGQGDGQHCFGSPCCSYIHREGLVLELAAEPRPETALSSSRGQLAVASRGQLVVCCGVCAC